jgi:hypothetical protein
MNPESQPRGRGFSLATLSCRSFLKWTEALPHTPLTALRLGAAYLPLMSPAYLSQKLDQPLPTKDGGTLRTIREACDYMTSMAKKRELRDHWQRVCKLILAKTDVQTVSRALKLALFMLSWPATCTPLVHACPHTQASGQSNTRKLVGPTFCSPTP